MLIEYVALERFWKVATSVEDFWLLQGFVDAMIVHRGRMRSYSLGVSDASAFRKCTARV